MDGIIDMLTFQYIQVYLKHVDNCNHHFLERNYTICNMILQCKQQNQQKYILRLNIIHLLFQMHTQYNI